MIFVARSSWFTISVYYFFSSNKKIRGFSDLYLIFNFGAKSGHHHAFWPKYKQTNTQTQETDTSQAGFRKYILLYIDTI